MNNFLLSIRYDGTRFHGWQRQLDTRTVQGELLNALSTMLGEDFALGTSSRTDAGVHALAHPVGLTTSRTIPPMGLLRGLNALLPRDMAVVDVRRVVPGFRSRAHALGKCYRYQVDEGRVPDPFLERYSWRVKNPLDVGAMRAGARYLVGEHNYDAFRSSQCDAPTTRRLVFAVHVERRGRLVCITVDGNAFLRNMVRIIAGTLVAVGQGREDPAWVGRVLAGKDRTQAGITAPARGLFLLGAHYPPELFW